MGMILFSFPRVLLFCVVSLTPSLPFFLLDPVAGLMQLRQVLLIRDSVLKIQGVLTIPISSSSSKAQQSSTSVPEHLVSTPKRRVLAGCIAATLVESFCYHYANLCPPSKSSDSICGRSMFLFIMSPSSLAMKQLL